MAPLINSSVQPYSPSEYIQTALTGNRVSRKAVILGSQNIILGGKCIIHHGVIIRGDLKRIMPPTKDGEQQKQQQQQQQQGNAVVVAIGRYCTLGEGCVIRPSYKTYRG